MQKIMFNDRYGLTEAVLSGRKTMTRRIIPNEFFSLTWDVRGNTLVYENADGDFIDIRNSKYCLYKLGEVVAVAQRYKDAGYIANTYEPLEEREYGYISRDGAEVIPMPWPIAGATNKMFVRADLMPHQIRITGIRVERLQDISDEDCLREGIRRMPDGGGYKPYAFYDTSIKIKSKKEGEIYGWYRSYDTSREAFAALIDKVSGRGTWDMNPYVVVYEFELVK